MAMKKTTTTKVTAPKKTVTTNVPRKGNPTVTSKAVTVSPKKTTRQTYHKDEKYIVMDAKGKPSYTTYEKFQKADPKKRQRMSGADATTLMKRYGM